MHDNVSPANVGYIELTNVGEEFLHELSPGDITFTKLGFCSIDVYPNEGQIPHFHIKSKSENWETCIEIYRSKYFTHGSKIGKLNGKQSRLLNEWLQKPNIDYGNISNWKLIHNFWRDQGNPMKNVPKNIIKQPDYTKIIN